MTLEGVPVLDHPEIADALTVLYCVLVLVERLRRAFVAPARPEGGGGGGELVGPLQRIAEGLERVGEAQAAQAAALERILQRLDRLDPAPGRAAERGRA